jgi:ribosome recycling factor
MAKKPAKRAGRKKRVELSPVRRAADRKIKELKKLDQTPNVRRALRQMSKVKAAVSAMCGPHMIFPV